MSTAILLMSGEIISVELINNPSFGGEGEGNLLLAKKNNNPKTA